MSPSGNSTFFRPRRKALFIATIGLLTAGAFRAHLWQRGRYKESLNRWEKINKALHTFSPQKLEEDELLNLLDRPRFEQDHSSNMAKSWEFKLIELQGNEMEDMIIVERAREGRMGVFLVKPFRIRNEKIKKTEDGELYDGIFVNHGWIPKDEVEPFIKGDSSGLSANTPKVNKQTVTGLVRRGEMHDQFQKNFSHSEKQDAYIFHTFDLEAICKIGNFQNFHKKIYIEKIVSNIDDENDSLYPVPFTKETFNRPYLTPQKHLDYSIFWGGATAIGVLSILSVLRK